ncbi:MAG: acyl carrier protein [Gammaproteobacteria bacterium]|nr:acyl carrier protein [Gammaproteobacteria bacterium]
MTPVQAAIARYIAVDILRRKPAQAPGLDQPLLAERVLDSLGLQQLITYLEAEYQIGIGDDHLLPENFESIRTIAALVVQLRN